MPELYLEKDGQQIQASVRDYLHIYKREGWIVLSEATPLFTMPDTEKVDLELLQARQGKII